MLRCLFGPWDSPVLRQFVRKKQSPQEGKAAGAGKHSQSLGNRRQAAAHRDLRAPPAKETGGRRTLRHPALSGTPGGQSPALPSEVCESPGAWNPGGKGYTSEILGQLCKQNTSLKTCGVYPLN